MKVSNEQEELDKYLEDKSYYEIYIELTQKFECRNTFEPLAFFRLIDSILLYWKNNFKHPEKITAYFEALDLTNKQRAYLYLHFCNWEYYPFLREDYPELTEDDAADLYFTVTEPFSEEYDALGFDFDPESTARIERLLDLEKNYPKQIYEEPDYYLHQENKGGTLARKVLIMHYLLEHLNVKNIDQTKKADLIQFLTGGSYKNIYDYIRNPFATKEGNFRKKDLQEIRPFFENLEMDEIVQAINKQLENN